MPSRTRFGHRVIPVRRSGDVFELAFDVCGGVCQLTTDGDRVDRCNISRIEAHKRVDSVSRVCDTLCSRVACFQA